MKRSPSKLLHRFFDVTRKNRQMNGRFCCVSSYQNLIHDGEIICENAANRYRA